MDPNQGQPINQPAPAPAAQPAAPAQPSVTPGSSGSKMMWIVLVIVALLVVGAVVGYMYMSGSSKPVEETAKPSTPKADNLESELDSVQIEDIEADFVQVDSDLQSL